MLPLVQDLEPAQLLRLRDVVGGAERGRARAGRVHEHEEPLEADVVHQRDRVLERRFVLGRIADDDVARQGEGGRRRPQHRGLLAILAAAVAAPHVGEDAVRSRLDGQVQVRADLRQPADGVGQPLVHVLGMGGREAQPLQARNGAHPLEQPREVEAAMAIRVHGLAEQHDLGIPARHERRHLVDDLAGVAAGLGPARPRHDAEAADVVAAFHHRDVGPHGARVGDGAGGDRERVRGSVEVDGRGGAAARGPQQLRNARDVVRPDEEVDLGRTVEDGAALELGHAAPDADDELAAVLDLLQPAQRVEQLLRGLLAHRARIDEDEVRVRRARRAPMAFGQQQPRDLLGVVHVHLAAERLDVERFFFIMRS